MKRLRQKILDLETGDCFAACVAMITEIPQDEVPNFCALPGDWWAHTEDWLQQRGWAIVLLQTPALKATGSEWASLIPARVPFIASGKTWVKGQVVEHSVVRVGTETFDPWPGGLPLKSYQYTDMVLLMKGLNDPVA